MRIFLIGLIIYLVVRMFARIGEGQGGSGGSGEPERKKAKKRGVPKELGEYVDYEEIKDK
ncbi:MAG: hypothetical protein MUE32_05135 [Bacteroidales bacterium]|nr:hypothetical protein [Bacteroidales bacterium]